MKQMNDTQSDIDTRNTPIRVFAIAAFILSIMVSSTTMAQSISSDENDQIVRAMYGFDYQDNTAADKDGIIDLSHSNFKTPASSISNKEADYTNFLRNPIYLNHSFNSLNFFASDTK